MPKENKRNIFVKKHIRFKIYKKNILTCSFPKKLSFILRSEGRRNNFPLNIFFGSCPTEKTVRKICDFSPINFPLSGQK